ncbi:MAG: DNA polymerase III subunit delta [Tsuneonella sp.]
MKATQKDFAAAAARAARQCRVFFFCGPDEAGAAAAAARLAAMLDDPGERVDLSGADLKRDPVLLGDEARSTSLFGDKRHIWVRATGDDAHDALANLVGGIDGGEGEACPVIVVATAATDKSRSAKLLEARSDSLVAMFWPPDLSTVTAAVRTMADEAGLRGVGGDLAERIARAAGLDVRLAESEIAKLALFLDASPAAPRSVDAESLDAIGARTEEDGFAPLVNAVLAGEVAKLAAELHRMREASLNPVGLLLAFERRAAQLAQLSARLGRRGDVDSFIGEETRARRVFFKEQREIAEQLKRWRGPRMERLVDRLIDLHRQLLATGQAGEVLLAQGLTAIAREASRAR